jgi:cytochrome c551/c552
MMKALVAISVAALVLVVGTAPVSYAADGKALFTEKKCNLCHSIESQGIQKKSEKMKGAELSDAGNFVPSADWLKKFLTQQELKDGQKHKRKWNGSDEELDTVVNWILSLKKS